MGILIIIILGMALFRLHMYLCGKQNKFLGLIIPGINFILSIAAVIGIVAFNNVKSTNGVEINQLSSGMEGVFQYILIFVMYNIPTLILLGIYFSIRKRLNNK